MLVPTLGTSPQLITHAVLGYNMPGGTSFEDCRLMTALPINWLRTIIIILALLQAGWMTFDGARAFVVGDYFTATSGANAGQLGPWTKVVRAAGIEPRSSFMKAIFVIFGLAWIFVIERFIQGLPWTWLAMFIAAIGTLWYLPLGTASSLIQIALLIILKRSPVSLD